MINLCNKGLVEGALGAGRTDLLLFYYGCDLRNPLQDLREFPPENKAVLHGLFLFES